MDRLRVPSAPSFAHRVFSSKSAPPFGDLPTYAVPRVPVTPPCPTVLDMRCVGGVVRVSVILDNKLPIFIFSPALRHMLKHGSYKLPVLKDPRIGQVTIRVEITWF